MTQWCLDYYVKCFAIHTIKTVLRLCIVLHRSLILARNIQERQKLKLW